MTTNRKKQVLDPERTLAILVGMQEFDDPKFLRIEPAAKNISEFKDVLLDKTIFGLPEKNIHVYLNKEDGKIEDDLERLAAEAKRDGFVTLLFYFVGHGYRRRKDSKYFLITRNSKISSIDRSGKSAIGWDELQDIIRGSLIKQHIVILDACYSGLIAQADAEEIVEEILPGGYRLSSTSATEKSYFAVEDEHTLFTGELLRILREGLDLEREILSLDDLYESVKAAVTAKNTAMVPYQKPSEEIQAAKYLFFRNRKFDGDAAYAKQVRETIRTYEKEMLAGEFLRAVDLLVGLKTRVQGQINKEELKEGLMAEIDELIDICASIEKYMPYVEPAIRKRYESQIVDLTVEIERLKAELRKLQSVHDKAVEDIRQKESIHDEVLGDWDVQLQSKEQALKEANTRIEAGKKENDNLKDKIAHLQARIQQLSTQTTKTPASRDFSDQVGSEQTHMVFIPGGTFQMGSPENDSDARDNEKPQHEVTLSDFYLSKYPVTQALWIAVMGRIPPKLKFKGQGDCPVESISWIDVQEFLAKLNAKTGKSYRLPSEAEWEYAARGGLKSNGYKYAGGDELKLVGWFVENSNNKTHDVGKLVPNELGLYDMSGNIWEWCQDKWHNNYDLAPIDGSPDMKGGDNKNVVRGGFWGHRERYSRVASRGHGGKTDRSERIGFRLAHSL